MNPENWKRGPFLRFDTSKPTASRGCVGEFVVINAIVRLRFDPSKKETCLPTTSRGCVGEFVATNTLAMAAPPSQHERNWMLLMLGPTEQAIQSTTELQANLEINSRVRSMLKTKFSDYGADYSTLRDSTTGAGAVAEVTMNTLKSILASTKGASPRCCPLLLCRALRCFRR